MSYRRANTCSYCYERGHNNRGCPKAKADANNPANGDGVRSPLQQWKEALAKMDRDTYTSMYRFGREMGWEYHIREAVEIQMEKEQRSKAPKTCNYCGESGHNKRTCPKIKKDKELIFRANRVYRQLAYDKLKELGIGVGSVFQGKHHRYNRAACQWEELDSIALVTGIHYDRIAYPSRFNFFHEKVNYRADPHYLQIRWANGETASACIPSFFRGRLDVGKGDESIRILHTGGRELTSLIGRGKLNDDPQWLEKWLSGDDLSSYVKTHFSTRNVGVLGRLYFDRILSLLGEKEG